jgi:hypothetical protein
MPKLDLKREGLVGLVLLIVVIVLAIRACRSEECCEESAADSASDAA